MPGGTHEYIQDPRNENVLIYINGEILPRPEAKVSVFDSGFLLGDGVWEGIRLHNDQLVFLEEHIGRLYTGAAAIGIDIGMHKNDLVEKNYKIFCKLTQLLSWSYYDSFFYIYKGLYSFLKFLKKYLNNRHRFKKP